MQGVCVAHNGFSNNYFVSVLGIVSWTTETPNNTTSQIA